MTKDINEYKRKFGEENPNLSVKCKECGERYGKHNWAECTGKYTTCEKLIQKRIGTSTHGNCCSCTECKNAHEDCTCDEIRLIKEVKSVVLDNVLDINIKTHEMWSELYKHGYEEKDMKDLNIVVLMGIFCKLHKEAVKKLE